MSMSKQDFIALADYIRAHNNGARLLNQSAIFTDMHIATLADFCRAQNGAFKRDRWLSYIAGECGPSGGAVKK